MKRALVLVGLVVASACNDQCLVEGLNCESLSTERQPFITVAAGYTHTCASSDYSTTCWGEEQVGESRPPLDFRALAAGRGFTCGVSGQDSLRCWGDPSVASQTPTTVRFLNVLTAGEHHACAGSTLVATFGVSTLCWGDNSFGQAEGFKQQMRLVAAGARHSCGVTIVDNAVHCWGANDVGQAPATESGLGVVALVAGAQFTCALTSGGSVRCWGSGAAASPPSILFRAISAGTSHVCGLTSTDRSIVCWGDDSFGQATPPQGSYAEIAAGDHHSCALDDAGLATCWGDDSFGQASPP